MMKSTLNNRIGNQLIPAEGCGDGLKGETVPLCSGRDDVSLTWWQAGCHSYDTDLRRDGRCEGTVERAHSHPGGGDKEKKRQGEDVMRGDGEEEEGEEGR